MMLRMKLENLKSQLPALENAIALADQQVEKCRSGVQVAYCSGDGAQEERAKQALSQAKQAVILSRAQLQAWRVQKKEIKQALKAQEKK